MATRPSGLRQPSAIRASNSNLASASSGTPAPAGVVPATPAAKTAGAGGNAVPSSMSRLPSSSSIRRKIAAPSGINPPGSRDSGLATDIDSFIIGDTVYVNGDPNKRGKICFIGEVTFAKGDFAGIVLDLPMGNHDGVVQGKRYFQCAPNHGLFTKLSRLSRDPILDSPSTPRAPESVAGSAIASPAPQLSRAASVVAERSPSPGGMRTPVRTPGMGLGMNSSLQIGERVIVASATGGTKIGILRYLGTTDFAVGDWAGVELLTPMGKNNGSVGGRSYFTCKEKHGLFVPASKVISSPVNKTPRRHGSRESLISVSSVASSAMSRSIRRPSVRDSQCLPTCSLQTVLSEKEKHMERLIKERELDRVDLANLSREFEEKKLEVKKLQLECVGYQQQLQSSTGDSEAVTRLQNLLDEEKRKLEDLQYTLDEEKIMKADIQAQLDGLMAKSSQESTILVEKSQAETEERQKELESLRAQLASVTDEAKSATAKFQEAQLKIDSLEKMVAELNQSVENLNKQIDSGKEEKAKLQANHKEEVAALKKTLTEKDESLATLNQKLGDKRRLEAELKEKCEKLQFEYETTLKQKCSLEAEVIDLVNSKTDTSDLMTGKIKDLNDELQELRGKLQSIEEDKAVLRRINAEFKSRLAQNETNEASLKKQIEEASTKLTEEKSASEKEYVEKLSALESEKQKLSDELKQKAEEVSSLKLKVTEAETKTADASSSSKELLQKIEDLNSTVTASQKRVEELQQLLRKTEQEKASVLSAKEAKEKELDASSKELKGKIDALSEQVSAKTKEADQYKTEIASLKDEVAKAQKNMTDNDSQLKDINEKLASLTEKEEDLNRANAELGLELDKLEKDKAALKEQLAAYKSDSKRFQEIEKGLSQEVVSLRSKLDHKNKMVTDLEKELLEKKADLESSKAQTLDANSPQAHIDFLNSIIVDLQRKNEELNVKLNVLINGGVDADANSNRVPGAGDSSGPRAYQSLRPYCDICEKFDLHDTEDCPQQVSEDNTHYGGNRGEPRPYCETCEIFGHATGECDDQETY